MRPRLRRLVAISLLVTAVDVSLLLVLARVVDWPVVVADIVAIVVAATISYALNRTITFADDPFVRWVHVPVAFVAIATLAGAVDVVVLQLLVSFTTIDDGGGLLLVKLVSLAAAASVRLAAYRSVLFTVVRRDLDERHPRPPAPGAVRFSVVIPAFNDASRIGDTVSQLRAALAPIAVDGGAEIVVVDDGSTDATSDAARRAGADQVVVQPGNRGKGAAVRAGMMVAQGRTLAFTDADLAYAPEQLVRLLDQVEAGWDVVVGSRKHTETITLVRARRLREVGGRVINVLTLAVLLGRYRDTQCGIKAFRSDVARLVFSRTRVDGFAFDVEVFHLVERYRLSLTEVPVQVANSTRSSVNAVPDALRLVRDLLRVRQGSARGWYSPEAAELDALVPPVGGPGGCPDAP